MKTTYVTLQQAEHLHKLKIDCTELITEGNAKAYDKKGNDVNFTTKQFHCWKPTLDYACKWLREYFDIHVTPNVNYNAYGAIYMCTVFYIKDNHIHNDLLKDEPLTIDYTPPQIFDTYELAQSAGFDYAIKLIAENKINKFSEREKEERLKRVEKLKKEEKKRLDKALANIKDSKIFKKIKPKK
jgi:hypothetical protein